MKIEAKDKLIPHFTFGQVPMGALFIWDDEVYLKACRCNSNCAYGVRVGASPYSNYNDNDFNNYDGCICDLSDDTRIEAIIENAKIVW